MEYPKLGHSGVIVSVLALGSMQFGRGMNMGNLDQDAAREMIRFALDQGINMIDTADVYGRGESETLAALDRVSDPGVPYPKWMELQLDQTEDPRPKLLEPSRFIDGGPRRDLRGRKRKAVD